MQLLRQLCCLHHHFTTFSVTSVTTGWHSIQAITSMRYRLALHQELCNGVCTLNLHWPHIPDGVMHKLGVTKFGCLHGELPSIWQTCLPVADITKQHLCSSCCQLLVTSCHCISTYSGQVSSVARSMVQNSVQDNLQDGCYY